MSKKCNMCGDIAMYVTEANYKSGKEKVYLCEKCALINEQIKKDKG